jgi:hypothetical protein
VEVVAQDDDEVLDSLTAAQALAACRGVVHTELARSPTWSVRRAVEPPPTDAGTRSCG